MDNNNLAKVYDFPYKRHAHEVFSQTMTPEEVADELAMLELRDKMHLLPPGKKEAWVDKHWKLIWLLGLIGFWAAVAAVDAFM